MAGVSELMKSLGIGKTSANRSWSEAASLLRILPSSSDAEPEMSPPGSQIPMDQIWDHMLKQLKDLSSATVEKNLELTHRVNQLEEELQVWKQARSVTVETAERDKRQHEDEKSMLQKRINVLESMQGSMVLCVLDGDGNIFADHLLAVGLEGGREAARSLTSGIWEYLEGLGYDGHSRFTFWLSIYFNRKGLQDTLVRSNVCTADQFEAFLVGISQASPRFLLVDVGHGKEAADAKIKEYLQTYTRFPQTLKVFFGGGHDNGYLPTLTALENERLLDKVVLLRGYHGVAAELKALNLPTLTLNNLFRGVKLVSPPSSRFAATPAPSEPENGVSSPSLKSGASPPVINSMYYNNNGQIAQKQILIDPNLPLTKQNPPPCNEFYLLRKCPRGENCKYGHAYALTSEMIAQLAKSAKNSPCGSVRKGVPCSFGPRCIWGHACPRGPTCFHFQQGKCWFKSAAAHANNESNGSGDTIHSPMELSPSFPAAPTNSLLRRIDTLSNFIIN